MIEGQPKTTKRRLKVRKRINIRPDGAVPVYRVIAELNLSVRFISPYRYKSESTVSLSLCSLFLDCIRDGDIIQ